jgi:hypothetical protein
LTGQADVRDVLGRVIETCFHQPELTEAFGADRDWAQVLARMEANAAPAPVELLIWPTDRPTDRPGLPLLPDRAPAGREALLAQRLPPTAANAGGSPVAGGTRRWGAERRAEVVLPSRAEHG